jgi:hypothetical protein
MRHVANIQIIFKKFRSSSNAVLFLLFLFLVDRLMAILLSDFVKKNRSLCIFKTETVGRKTIFISLCILL